MSQLLNHLPAIYREEPSPNGDASFFSRFLEPFEALLLDGGEDFLSLEQRIQQIPALLSAQDTPEEFLNWLAQWVALDLHPELSLPRRRKLVAQIASLYRIRGTRAYLEQMLRLTLDALPLVVDTELPGLQIARHSTVGENTYLGGGPPFLFQVTLAFSRRDRDFVQQQSRLARDVIDMEKPAHSWYELRLTFPRFQIGDHSTLGVNTVLAPRERNNKPRAGEERL